MKIEFEWEPLENHIGIGTRRAKVFGGWIINSWDTRKSNSESMVFVPDINHAWEIEE